MEVPQQAQEEMMFVASLLPNFTIIFLKLANLNEL